jgi:hypothetical protein
MTMKSIYGFGAGTFVGLRAALEESIPDQVDGHSYSISDIGEPYIEFFAKGLARPGDERVVEGIVVEQIARQLAAYLDRRRGRVYWRERLQLEIEPQHIVVKFDSNGPDVDPLTNRRCVMDKNWLRVGAYCRLIRALEPTSDLYGHAGAQKVA